MFLMHFEIIITLAINGGGYFIDYMQNLIPESMNLHNHIFFSSTPP